MQIAASLGCQRPGDFFLTDNTIVAARVQHAGNEAKLLERRTVHSVRVHMCCAPCVFVWTERKYDPATHSSLCRCKSDRRVVYSDMQRLSKECDKHTHTHTTSAQKELLSMFDLCVNVCGYERDGGRMEDWKYFPAVLASAGCAHASVWEYHKAQRLQTPFWSKWQIHGSVWSSSKVAECWWGS